MRLLIVGGSFDPPHLGHIAIVNAAKKKVNPDLTLIVPSLISPLKTQGASASFHHRFAMLNSCFRNLSDIEIDDIEAKRKGKSYTIDTIFTLREKYNRSSEYYLLIGADNLITIKEWKDWEKLLELVNFLVVPRQDIDLQSVDAAVKRKVTVLETPLYPYSSSEIRNNINDERYIKSALTADCLEYIHKNGLYGIK